MSDSLADMIALGLIVGGIVGAINPRAFFMIMVAAGIGLAAVTALFSA